MKIQHVFSTLSILVLFSASFCSANESPLLSQQAVEPYGLTRAWFNQVEIDPVRSKVLHAIVEGGTMFVVSDDAKIHAIDAENGKSLWVRSMGSREMLYQEPAANSRMVSVVNGLDLFVFDRRNGKLLLKTSLPGAASTSCEMSENYVYIPMIGARVVAYPLEDNATRMESENAPESAVVQDAREEDTTESSETPGNVDPVLANIVKEFAVAKDSVMAEPPPVPEEERVVLRGAIGIPMVCQSFGNLLVKPRLSSQILVYTPRNHVRMHRETVTWVTDRGYLFAAGVNSLSQEHFELRYMVDSSAQKYYLSSDRIAQREWTKNKEIVVRPTPNQCLPYVYESDKPNGSEIPSLVVTGSRGAYVFAVRDRTGEVEWQFAASGPIVEQIGVIGTDVYCPTENTGMYALSLIDGTEKWFAPDIRRFVAASKKRLYTVDKRERLVILDRETGNTLGAFDVRKYDQLLFNIETDRIYLVNESGLIQCLMERQTQTEEDLLANKPIPEIRHRLSCMQYADAMRGKKIPSLYWMESGEDEEVDDSTPESDVDDDDPFGAVRPARPSGDNENLDGEDMDTEEDDEEDSEMDDEDDDIDPFG